MSVGDRVRLVRELKGLTQKSLAKSLDVHQSAIAHIESGRNDPGDELTRALSFHTGFPPSFFADGELPTFSAGTLMFRARAATTARERLQAYRYAQVVFEIAEKLSRNFDEIPVRLPHIDEDPHKAARAMRASLGLPENEPLERLMNPLEQFGVFILAIPLGSKTRDAFSLWASARPVIAIFADKPADRLRWNISHELRHLTVRSKGTVAEIERDADLFAAEFLMPEKAMLTDLRESPVTLQRLVTLKATWGVSIQALARRAFELEIISERQYRYLFEQIGRLGWRTKEPVELVPEMPRALRKMAEAVYGVPIDYRSLSSDLHLPHVFTKELFEKYTGSEPVKSDKRGTLLQFRSSSSSGRGQPS
jgi:Zn-dependent peptidase ImmA (M78 family)/DNA-binding XRE family transcriptional regulator